MVPFVTAPRDRSCRILSQYSPSPSHHQRNRPPVVALRCMEEGASWLSLLMSFTQKDEGIEPKEPRKRTFQRCPSQVDGLDDVLNFIAFKSPVERYHNWRTSYPRAFHTEVYCNYN